MGAEPTGRFSIPVRGPFSLQAARELQCGFLRGTRSCAADPDTVRLAFPRDVSFDVVGVEVKRFGARIDGSVTGTADGERVGKQVARVLALDHDGERFAEVVAADPVLRRLWDERPGFRPVVSYSPYVMAGWAVLSQRMRMDQAAALQVRIAQAVGDTVQLGGEAVASFPRPRSLLALQGFPGIAEEKWKRLQVIARAALDGDLEIDELMSRPYAESRERLLRLHGVGPWTADAILLRGCGPVDILPLSEPTLHAAVAQAYGLEQVPDDDELVTIAERWKPFRTWASIFVIFSCYRSLSRIQASISSTDDCRVAPAPA